MALDEACVGVNGLEYWVYSAVDVDKNELVYMRAQPTQRGTPPTTLWFLRGVIGRCVVVGGAHVRG